MMNSGKEWGKWEITVSCPVCGGTVYASGVASPGDDPYHGTFQDHHAMCYQCGQSYTVELRNEPFRHLRVLDADGHEVL